MAFGVTPEGFARKDLQTIKQEVEEQQRDELGQGINQRGDSVLGQLNGIVFNALAELWEVAEAIYASQYPDSATGQSLDGVAAITGTRRRGQTSSTVLVDVNLDGAFTLPAGSVVFDPARPDDTRFLVDADVTNPGGSPATIPGVAFTAETPGPVVANAGTLTGGPELVTGWNSATNPEDAEVGMTVETDAELRLRRAQEVAGPGGASLDAIRADVLKVVGVISASVIENTTAVPDAFGVPPHAFEVIVLGGDDDEIAAAIFANKAAGILAFGSTVVLVQDSEGDDVSIGFTRPTERDVWLEYDLAVDGDYPGGGDDAVKEAVVDFARSAFGQSQDVIESRLAAPAFDVLGVRDVIEIRLGFAPAPVGTANLPIGVREIADFDTSRVLVSTVAFVDL